MKKSISQVLILTFILTVFSYGQSNSWNSLTPLRSTRADVEKLFGKPLETSYNFCCKYKTEQENISVNYASHNCDGGWNVPKDTVLSIDISSKTDVNKSSDELKLDKSKFSVSLDDAFDATWTNAEEGLSYNFSNIGTELTSMKYIPKKTDNNLRCNGFPPYMSEAQYYPMDVVYRFVNPESNKKEDLFDIFARADNLFIQLSGEDNKSKNKYKGYILVYFDNKLSLKEYRIRLGKLRNHIFKTRQISPELITVIEGGMREESLIEFYILPKEWKPPAPNPTLPSPQFMK